MAKKKEKYSITFTLDDCDRPGYIEFEGTLKEAKEYADLRAKNGGLKVREVRPCE